MKKILSVLLNFIFMFCPVKKNKIIFETGRGKIDDNPLAIYHYMKKNNPEYRLIWLAKKGTDTSELDGGEVYYYRTFKAYYHLATAKYWVRSNSLDSLVKKRKNQKCLYVNHGNLGLKKCEYDITNPKERPPLPFTRDWDYYIAASDTDLKLIRSSTGYAGVGVVLGMARTDKLVFLDENKINDIKNKLGITSKDKKIVLYAPTFRDSDLEKGFMDYNVNKLADIPDVLVVATVHPLAKGLVDRDSFDKKIIDAIDYPDMNDLLMISDVLITDYSSNIFDFCILRKPIVFYPYDYDEYTAYRGQFYLDYKKDLPGPIAYNIDELYEYIKNIDKVKEEYKEKLEKFNFIYNHMHDGHACERFVKELKSGNFDM